MYLHIALSVNKLYINQAKTWKN